MNCIAWPSVEWRITGDGLLTFVGGLLAFFAVLLQVWRTDRGLRTQLDTEKRAREDANSAQLHAIASALAFEIDGIYKGYIRDVLDLIGKQTPSSPPITIKPIIGNLTPVYASNAGIVGSLPPMLVEVIVHYYGIVQAYLGTLSMYSQAYQMMLEGNSQIGMALMKSLIPRIASEAREIVQITYSTCGVLCTFVGIPFDYPSIGVAQDSNVGEDAKATLRLAIEQLPFGARG